MTNTLYTSMDAVSVNFHYSLSPSDDRFCATSLENKCTQRSTFTNLHDTTIRPTLHNVGENRKLSCRKKLGVCSQSWAAIPGGWGGYVPSNIWAGGQHTSCLPLFAPKRSSFSFKFQLCVSNQAKATFLHLKQVNFFLLTSLADYLQP